MKLSDSSHIWRTNWEPLEDITAWEIAKDMKYVNASQILSSRDCEALGSALRHRTIDEHGRRHLRMDAIWEELKRDNKD